MPMTKVEYLKLCFKNRCFQKKAWMLSVFSVVGNDKATLSVLDNTPYALYRTEDGYFFKQPDGVLVEVEGDLSGPFLYKDERIIVDSELCGNVKEPMESTVGLLILNRLTLFECFGHLATYHNKPFSAGLIKGYIKQLMCDDVPEGELPPEGKVQAKDCLRISKQFDYLVGLNSIFCKAASIDALTVHKEVLDLKAKLLKENPGAMTDPIKAAWIIEQLVEMDMKIQMSGPSKDFFINKKFVDNARKRMFLAFGVEQDWNTGEYKFLPDSLDDGIDFDQLNMYVNTAISGSYDRGKATGEGGAAVKDITRLTSLIKIHSGDCGTPLTESILITKDQLGDWAGAFYKSGNGLKELTGKENELIGKVLEIRTPNICQQADGDYCSVCTGTSLSEAEDGLSLECSDIPTGFMLYKLKQHHISGFTVKHYTLEELFE